MEKMKVLVAMSGGVDSSTAAALLKEAGHHVLGATMKLYATAGREGLKSCCGFGPANDAKRVAEALGIRHIVLNAEKIFESEVVQDFCDEYASGRTPNPCIRCNTFLKFDFLVKQARALGMDYVATGHYARIADGRLYAAADPAKDQSYFLYTLTPQILGKVLFPVGDRSKSEIRRLAKSFGLPVHDKKESQDICFLPRGRYREFLESRGVKGIKGFMFNARGEVAGEHSGLYRYTIGQRKGLGPHGKKAYVVSMDAGTNSIVIGERQDLAADGAELDHLSFCAEAPVAGQEFEVRLRYRGRPKKARVESLSDGVLRMAFESPAESVAPGQAAVLYRGEEVAGGGVIVRKI